MACNAALKWNGAASAAGSPSVCPAFCTPAVHFPKGPALLLRPPSCLVHQRHWRAQVVAVVVVDGDVGVLLSLLFLQLSLYATDHGLREGQGQRVTGGAPVWLACGNGLTSRGFAGRGTHA